MKRFIDLPFETTANKLKEEAFIEPLDSRFVIAQFSEMATLDE